MVWMVWGVRGVRGGGGSPRPGTVPANARALPFGVVGRGLVLLTRSVIGLILLEIFFILSLSVFIFLVLLDVAGRESTSDASLRI